MVMAEFRREALVYTLALAFLALMALGSYAIIDSIVTRQQHMATVIDVSGRQRMLCQRIALLGLQLSHTRLGTDQDRITTQLRESIDLMRRSHRDLVEGSLALGIDPPQQKPLKDIYYAPPHELNRQVPAFLAAADQVVAAADQGDVRKVADSAAKVDALASEALLDSLNAAVNEYAADSEAMFRRSQLRVMTITIAMLIALGTEAMFIFRPLFRRMNNLVDMAQSDPLTGCWNRRSVLDAANRDFARSWRTASPLSVIFMDIDHFKHINDSHGHLAGDAVIRTLTSTVKAALRTSDMLGRIGGEEFVVLLVDTDCQNAAMVAEKLRLQLAGTPVFYDKTEISFTVSLGVAEIRAGDADALSLIDRADSLMYRAKSGGRNLVCSEQDRTA